MNNHRNLFVLFVLILSSFGQVQVALAGPFAPNDPQHIAEKKYVSKGYTCEYSIKDVGAWARHSLICTKLLPDTYGANVVSPWTLTGIKTAGELEEVVAWSMNVFMGLSPFIYLKNAPEGPVSVSLDSPLDTYFPKPTFNQENGWLLSSNNGEVSLDGTKVEHLYYEFVANTITLTRNGRNFSSKEELTTYLNESDFLTKMGFSTTEANNSKNAVWAQLKDAPISNNYYLTVLDDTSVSELSSLNISPTPDKVDRHYFAIYPTSVPVKTTGDFVFPKTTPDTGFTVKETGELLLTDDIFVTFK